MGEADGLRAVRGAGRASGGCGRPGDALLAVAARGSNPALRSGRRARGPRRGPTATAPALATATATTAAAAFPRSGPWPHQRGGQPGDPPLPALLPRAAERRRGGPGPLRSARPRLGPARAARLQRLQRPPRAEQPQAAGAKAAGGRRGRLRGRAPARAAHPAGPRRLCAVLRAGRPPRGLPRAGAELLQRLHRSDGAAGAGLAGDAGGAEEDVGAAAGHQPGAEGPQRRVRRVSGRHERRAHHTLPAPLPREVPPAGAEDQPSVPAVQEARGPAQRLRPRPHGRTGRIISPWQNWRDKIAMA